ncbi:MAG TPA: pyridoxal 5'-phosphate synthase glutaminase subunit PdxT [Mycobacteriales bacterium]|nr:pyridoxal 5'-phosphate synthase glutaminase subunit PdxT [Mycobacteriales bacterium]
MTAPRVGVLALQGDVREHTVALERAGAHPVPVRRAADLDGLDGVVLPGGESTTLGRLLVLFDVLEPLQALLAQGLPAFGTCAGMILLAREVVDGRQDQPVLGGLDITVRRNAFGSQVDSFEQDLDVRGVGEVHGVFIRAPWVERTGPDVEVLASVGEHPVAVRQGSLMATSFHPELTGDHRVHALFLASITGGTAVRDAEGRVR